jgi:hypothetical protein
MHRKPELARRGSRERLGTGKATPGEVLWRAEWASSMATATTIQIKLLNEDGAFVEYCLALALNTIPENSGNLDPVSKFVQLRKALPAVALQVFRVGNSVGCVHDIPEIATTSKTGDGQNKQWIDNSHIDLVT